MTAVSAEACSKTGSSSPDELYKTFRDGTQGFAELAAFQAGHNLVAARRAGSNHPGRVYGWRICLGETISLFLALAPMPGGCSLHRMTTRVRSRWR